MSEAPSRFTAPLQVILMFAIILATILLGFLMMPDTQEERDQLLAGLGTTNHGRLLEPAVSLERLALADKNGNPWRLADRKSKWRLLIPGGANCDGDCEKLLYTTRQVHVRLGKYAHRIERLYVAVDGEIKSPLTEHLLEDHRYVDVVNTSRAAFESWLGGTNSHWREGKAEAILVDPAGLAMMVYDAGHSGNDMLEDINHLLKYSPE